MYTNNHLFCFFLSYMRLISYKRCWIARDKAGKINPWLHHGKNGKEGGADRQIRNEKILQKPWWWDVCLDQWTVSLCLVVLNGRHRRWSNSNHSHRIAPPLWSDYLKTLLSIILAPVAMAKYTFVPPIEINPWHNAVKRECVKHVNVADLTTEEWIRNYCKLHFLNRAQSLITPINETPETCHTFTRPIMWTETAHSLMKSESLCSAQ